MALSAAQHARRDRILTQAHPARIGNTVDAVVLKHGRLFMLADDRGVFFTTPHFDGYPAVLVRIPDLDRLDREDLHDMVIEAWLTRAQKRVAKAWLAEHGVADEPADRP